MHVIVRAKAKKEGGDGDGGWVYKGSPLSKQISFFSFFSFHLMEKHIGGRQMLITLSLWTMPSNEKSKENWNRWRCGSCGACNAIRTLLLSLKSFRRPYLRSTQRDIQSPTYICLTLPVQLSTYVHLRKRRRAYLFICYPDRQAKWLSKWAAMLLESSAGDIAWQYETDDDLLSSNLFFSFL